MALSKLNYNSLNLTPVAGKGIGFDSGADDLEASFSGGSMVFISKSTASSSSTISFTSGIDSTYKEYLFIFKNIHPSAESDLLFQANAVGASGFNETITSSFFRAYHNEAGTDTTLAYVAGLDQAQGTGFSTLTDGIGSSSGTVNNDDNASGYLRLFNPSSTTFVKHFMGVTNQQNPAVYSVNNYFAGYFNTTSAIDEIQFKMASGNIDAGTITLYGIN
jgi:hypothetical protein